MVLTGLLSAVGLGLVALVSTERTIVGNVQVGMDVRYAADALAERVIAELADWPDWSPALAGLDRSTFASASLSPLTPWRQRLVLTQLTADLQRQGNLGGATGANVPVWQLFAWGSMDDLVGEGPSTQAYVIAWVADDESEQDGDPTRDANGRVQVQVEARGLGGLRSSVHLVLKRRDADSSVTGGRASTGETSTEGDSDDLARDLRDWTSGRESVVGPTAGLRLLSWRDDER